MVGSVIGYSTTFFPFYFVHGKSMILLGIMCTINIIMGYIFSNVPLVFFAYSDAAIKFIFGVYLLFFSKVTKQ